MERAFYSATVNTFLSQSENEILGQLALNNPFSLEDLQRNAWLEEIRILKHTLEKINRGILLLSTQYHA